MRNQSLILKKSRIRIIAGKWKGRKISVINHPTVRPTIAKIRETLFNWLNPIISNSICLDCFTGSGALGIESLSRGAQKVTCIDINRKCIDSLTQTIRMFQHSLSVEIIHSDCRLWLQQSNKTYDIIFIDPPFSNSILILEVIWLLEKYNHFKKQSWIYIETFKKCDIFSLYNFPVNWSLYRKQSTHSSSFYLYHRN